MNKFTAGDKITVIFEDSLVNAIYVGNTSVFCVKLDLHEYKDGRGNLCLASIENIEPGHHRRGKKSAVRK